MQHKLQDLVFPDILHDTMSPSEAATGDLLTTFTGLRRLHMLRCDFRSDRGCIAFWIPDIPRLQTQAIGLSDMCRIVSREDQRPNCAPRRAGSIAGWRENSNLRRASTLPTHLLPWLKIVKKEFWGRMGECSANSRGHKSPAQHFPHLLHDYKETEHSLDFSLTAKLDWYPSRITNKILLHFLEPVYSVFSNLVLSWLVF